MKNVSELFDLEIPGYGWVSWNVRFEDVAPHFPRQSVSVRGENPERPQYAPGECAKRCAIISTSGRICGVDAAVDLNFRDERLCAVHYHFHETPELQGGDYEALIDCLRSKLSASLGSPSASEGTGGEVWVRCQGAAHKVRFEVQDTGVGVPADKLPTLWEDFTQMADPLRRGVEGLGLGLALVKYVVNAHGGDVFACGEEGVCSTFGFKIPVRD